MRTPRAATSSAGAGAARPRGRARCPRGRRGPRGTASSAGPPRPRRGSSRGCGRASAPRCGRHHSGPIRSGPSAREHPARDAPPDEPRGQPVGQLGQGLDRLGRVEQEERAGPVVGADRSRREGSARPAFAALGDMALDQDRPAHRVLAQLAPPAGRSGAARASARGGLACRARSRPGARRAPRPSAPRASGRRRRSRGRAAPARAPSAGGSGAARAAEGALRPASIGGGPPVGAEGGQPDAPRALAVALELGGQRLGQRRQHVADARPCRAIGSAKACQVR